MMTRSGAERDLVRDLEQSTSKKEFVAKLFRSFTLWNMSTSLLDLQLLLKQAGATPGANAVRVCALYLQLIVSGMHKVGRPRGGGGV